MDWEGAVEAGPVARMADCLTHRGPDGDGVWRDPTGVAILGHRRLKVLDTSDRADQPMVDASGGVLVYNGEFYGFQEERRRLVDEGRRFRSTGDTEVVAAVLGRYGAGGIDRLDGMFALAWWDPERRTLLLARDRIGIKPLFFARVRRGVVFASDIAALCAHPGVSRAVDRDRLGDWLQLGYTCGDRTLLRGVGRVEPGTFVQATSGSVVVRRYYDLVGAVPPVPRRASRSGTVEETVAALRSSVEARLVSDVPLGCFLSGGVDSTAVVAAARAAGSVPETITVRFAGGTDEAGAAERTARALGLRHLVETCSPGEMAEAVDLWPRLAADPLADPSLAPTWVVSRAARRRWTVALSGDGGDELLGGYPRLAAMPRLEPLLRLPRGLRRRLPVPAPGRRWGAKLKAAWAAPTPWTAYQALQGVWPAAEASRLLGRELDLPWSADLLRRLDVVPPVLRYRLLDAATFLPERVLAKVDRASMACSLEVRVPLLDHRVAELLLSLPPTATRGKRVLRAAAESLGAPPPARGKRGFEVPLGLWLRGPLHDEAAALVLGDTAADLGLDRGLLRATWDRHQRGTADHGERLFAVAVLVRWAELWLG